MQLIPVWRVLVSFSRSKFVHSSLLWVAIVPVVARMIEGANRTFMIRVGENVHTFHLAVPFTWSLFFFGALFFLLGNLVVNWKAPRVIRETQTFRDFTDQARSVTELQDLASALQPAGRITEQRVEQTQNELMTIRGRMTGTIYNNTPDITPVMGSTLSAAYEFIVNEAWNYSRRNWRLAAAISYAVGILFYGSVLVQSTGFVLTHLLRDVAH
jgi:hypothetical protein